MRFAIFLGMIIAMTAARVSAQGPVVLYDPVSKLPERGHTDAEEKIVRDKLVPKAAARWSEIEACDGGSLNIIGAVDGSFTKAGAKQRVLLYELCQTGNGLANNGLAVIENGRVVAHFAEEGGWNLEIARVPDLNRNGRDELAVETGGGMHQGYMGASLTVMELTESAAADIGVFLVYTNECEVPVADKYCERSYKLTAAAGAKPSFMVQKFTNRGDDQKPRWVAAGKPLRAKRLAGVTSKYEVLK